MNKNELSFILKKGEGQLVEFKENPNKSLSKEIVAFANANGGKIFIGITDDGIIKNIKISNKLKSQIQDVAINCDPKIIVNIEQFENILIINVKEGSNKPYSCKDGFYLRIGANSYPEKFLMSSKVVCAN